MQNELKISSTEFTPEVNLNAETGNLFFQGRSMPEDIAGFFDPISDWIKAYIENPKEKTELTIFYEYYNSSTARRMTEIIFDLEILQERGHEVKVIWCYKSGDMIMKENGEEIQSVIEVPFELQQITA